MTQFQTRFTRIGFSPRPARGSGLMSSIMWLGGLIATGIAMTIGALLAVFTAVAVAVFALVAGVVLFFTGFAMRARRAARTRTAAAGPDGVIEAEKVGDTWVAHGWERQGR